MKQDDRRCGPKEGPLARFSSKTRGTRLAWVLAGVYLLPVPLLAAPKRHSTSKTSKQHTIRKHHTASSAYESAPTKTRTVSARSSTSTAKSSSRVRHGRAVRQKPAWARQHLEPQRVEEIQRALAEAGYFRGEPSGQWDDQTREAMRRYQTSNGFGSTGLPDAKSLMKLGLGPHPLPSDVGPKSSATASLDPSTKTDSQPDPAPER